jgi:hypothetical protein
MHKIDIENIHKYLQQKSKQNLLQKQTKLIAKTGQNLLQNHQIVALA